MSIIALEVMPVGHAWDSWVLGGVYGEPEYWKSPPIHAGGNARCEPDGACAANEDLARDCAAAQAAIYGRGYA